MTHYSCLAFFLLLISATAHAQTRSSETPEDLSAETASWQLALNEEGILVHFREKANSPLYEVKAETIVKGDMESAFAILRDPMHILTADPYIRNPEQVGEADSLGAYYHAEVHTPFFLKERDFVMKAYSSKIPSGYFIIWKSFYDYIPESENLVRMKNITTIIYLKKLSEEYYSLTYKISMSDAAGDLVVNFANKAMLQSSLERLKAFRKLVLSPLPAAALSAGSPHK